MLIWLVVGCCAVLASTGLAFWSVFRMTAKLGALDGEQLSRFLRQETHLKFSSTSSVMAYPESLVSRLLSASVMNESWKEASAVQRSLMVGEAVADLERECMHDVRIPRMAASLASTSGLLSAALVMRDGLSSMVQSGDSMTAFTHVIERGLFLAALAASGGVTCVVLHRLAQRERKRCFSDLDTLSAQILAQEGVLADEGVRQIFDGRSSSSCPQPMNEK